MSWLRCLNSFTRFVAAESAKPIAPVILIPVRDPFLRPPKEFDEYDPSRRGGKETNRGCSSPRVGTTSGGPTSTCSCALQSTESDAPHGVVEPRGKVEAESPENPKRKRKLAKAIETRPKKSKLISSAMPATSVIEVCFVVKAIFFFIFKFPCF